MQRESIYAFKLESINMSLSFKCYEHMVEICNAATITFTSTKSQKLEHHENVSIMCPEPSKPHG